MGGVCTHEAIKSLLQDLVQTDELEVCSYSLGIRKRSFEKPYGPGHYRYQGFPPEPQKGEAHLWEFTEEPGFQISITASNKVDIIEVATKEEAIEMVKREPHVYFGCHWCQSGWSAPQSWGKNQARVYLRECNSFRDGLEQKTNKNAYCALVARYKQLDVDVDPSHEVRDVYTDGNLKRFKDADYPPVQMPRTSSGRC